MTNPIPFIECWHRNSWTEEECIGMLRTTRPMWNKFVAENERKVHPNKGGRYNGKKVQEAWEAWD